MRCPTDDIVVCSRGSAKVVDEFLLRRIIDVRTKSSASLGLEKQRQAGILEISLLMFL